ncbi:immunity 17 family protein [Ruminococcus albus]|uniref:Immunity protein 17 n=1 Tax=Ruminococcus albus TaxID=1264 RepID=A0A1H7N104_RUMAL|nr:immunity 17 family protein [Ruminococcus albus]SEL16999.1 Immunity protein 17 [Ruminococcus albus]
MSDPLIALLIILAGGFSIFCAYKDYDWYMDSRKARFWVRILGRDDARKFYIGIGVFLVLIGVVTLFVSI